MACLSNLLKYYYEKVMNSNPKKIFKILLAKKTSVEKLAERMSEYWQNTVIFVCNQTNDSLYLAPLALPNSFRNEQTAKLILQWVKEMDCNIYPVE